MILTNAFSINMLEDETALRFTPVTLEVARVIVQHNSITNVIGHADLDIIVRELLGKKNVLPGKRATVAYKPPEMMLVAQYRGPRLPEGTTQLPKGATIEFWHIAPYA